MSRVSLAPSDKVAGFSLTKHSAWESQPLMSCTTAPLSLPLGAADFSPSIGHPVQELGVPNMRALSQKNSTELSPLLAPGLGNCSILTVISPKQSLFEYTLPACSHSLFPPRHVLSMPSPPQTGATSHPTAGMWESAFIPAVCAASIAFAVTRACSRGELEKCGCDHKIRGVSPEGEGGGWWQGGGGRGENPWGRQSPGGEGTSALWEFLTGLVPLHLMVAFPLQVSDGQAALITCLMGLPFLKPL